MNSSKAGFMLVPKIAHRNNEKFIEQFSRLVRVPQASIEVLPTSGLYGFYTEENGLLMGTNLRPIERDWATCSVF